MISQGAISELRGENRQIKANCFAFIGSEPKRSERSVAVKANKSGFIGGFLGKMTGGLAETTITGQALNFHFHDIIQ